MKRWAVGYINFDNNELKIEIVPAESWRSALSQHSFIGPSGHLDEALPADIEDAKSEFFNQDAMFDCVEIDP